MLVYKNDPEYEKRKKSAKFNGRLYNRSQYIFSTKEDVKQYKKKMKSKGIDSIVDKNKEGYFVWKYVTPKRIKGMDEKRKQKKIESLQSELRDIQKEGDHWYEISAHTGKRKDVTKKLREIRDRKMEIKEKIRQLKNK